MVMPPTTDTDDDLESILEPIRKELSYELKQEVPVEQAARVLLERNDRLDELKRALRRGRVSISPRTSNLVIQNRDGVNLLVLSPSDAASLGSMLSVKAHAAVEEGSDDE